MVTVKVKDLLARAKELETDGVEYVGIEECEANNDFSKHLQFEAYNGSGGTVEYEEIEHVEVSLYYKS